MATGTGSTTTILSPGEAKAIVEQGIPASRVAGKRVLVLTPDATRTAPLPLMVRVLADTIGKYSARLDFMVALGTHQPLCEAAILDLYGLSPREKDRLLPGSRLMNHRWDLPGELTVIGRLGEDEVTELTGGLFRRGVDVAVNRHVPGLRPDRDLGSGVPPRGGRVLRGPQVPVPRGLGGRPAALHALAGGRGHLLRDHRRQGHPGAPGHRARRRSGRRAPAVPGHGGHQGRAGRALRGRDPGRLGAGRRPLGQAARPARGQALPHRAGHGRPHVPGAVGGGQGDVQARARGGRRRPADHPRPAHRPGAPRDTSRGGRKSRASATTRGIISSIAWRTSRTCPWGCWPTPPTSRGWGAW